MNKQIPKLKRSYLGFLGCMLIISPFQNQVFAKSSLLIPLKDVNSIHSETALFGLMRENITGKITDSSGEPLPGVSVKIKGSASGTVTDANGVFRLNLPTGKETLVISYLGFNSQEVSVNNKNEIIIVMTVSTSKLDEVVVTGYGSKKRSEIVGSVATISGAELEDIPSPTIAGALRNRITGLGVSETSGRPGSNISLNIRNASVSEQGALVGATSEPLYIIDGITVPAADFNNIDPSMVETITVLKDASSAIYGAAGAKGVVLITTKRGKQGKPSITYNGYVGVSDAAQRPEMLSAFDLATLLNEGNQVKGNASSNAFFSPSDLELIKGLNYKSWFDEVWSSSLTQRHNLSVSGGSEKITFFVGGSYQNENGNYAGLKQDRYSFRSGISAKVAEGFTADLSFNVDNRIRNSKSSVTETDANFFESIVTTPQWVPISINGLYINTDRRNPLAILESGFYQNSKSQNYRINASLSYQPKFFKDLTAKVQFSTAGLSSKSRQYAPPYNLYNYTRKGNNNALYTDQLSNPASGVAPVFAAVTQTASYINPTIATGNNYQGFVTLNYDKKIGIHSIGATIGAEQTVGNTEDLSIQLNNQIIPGSSDWFAFDQNTLVRKSSAITETTKRSFFGRLNYDWDKKYLIEAVARLDASSNFATGNRYGLSPSVGLAWIASQEEFFKRNVSFVNFLKLKFNIGIAGDDRVDARLWQERLTIDGSGNGYLFGTNNGIGLNPSVYPNPNITWEKKRTINAGLEASILNNKIDLAIDVFQNFTYDGFDKGADRLYPQYAGFTAPVVNYREVYNWGSEFSIGYKAKIANKVNFNANMNFGFGNSVITQIIYPSSDALELNLNDGKYLGNRFGTDPRQYNSSNIGLKSMGMFRTQEQVDTYLSKYPNYKIYAQTPQPGWLYYEDTNGDGIINDYDMVPLYENTNSFFATGLTLGFSFKDLALSTNIAAKFGGRTFYDSRARSAPSLTTNVPSFWTDHWSLNNTEGRFPRFDDPTINKNSDFWAVSATTIRVNNMTLSYKVPAKYAQKLGLGTARILLTGNNLWTIINPLDYKDPYTSSVYNYPTLRTISVGLSVNL